MSTNDNDDDVGYPNFESTHFPSNIFFLKFISCIVFSSYYVEIVCMTSLKICNKNLKELLERVGWHNALNIEENVYPNSVKVFYSTMDISIEHQKFP